MMLSFRLNSIGLLFCLALCIATTERAIANSFDHLLDAQGNALINVRNMVFDQQGFLWFGGDAGVYRFDGYQLVNVNKQPTRGLYLDQQNRFWSTGTTTLMALTKGNFRAIEYPNLSNQEFKPEHEIIHQHYTSTDGRQFFASKEGLSEYFYLQDSFTHYDVKTGENAAKIAVTQLLQVSPERIYVGTTLGLYSIELAQINHQKLKQNQLILPSALLKQIHVTAMSFDYHNKQLVVGSKSGLYILDHNGNLIEHVNQHSPQGLSNNNITALLHDHTGHLWVGTSHGLNLSRPQDRPANEQSPDLNPEQNRGQTQRTFEQFFHRENDSKSISNNLITDIKQDGNNNILIATYSGIERYHHSEINIQPHPGLAKLNHSMSNVWSMAQDHQGNLWIGTFGSGLSRLNTTLNPTTIQQFMPRTTVLGQNNPNGLASTRVPSLLADNNQLYIGTTKGLQVFNYQTEQFQHIALIDGQRDKSDKTVFDIAKAPDQSLWLATSTGIVNLSADLTKAKFYDKHSAQRIQYKQWVRTVLPLDHRVLVGSDKGLHIINQNSQHVTRLEQAGSVVKIFKDSSAQVWVVGLEQVMLFDQALGQLQPFELIPTDDFKSAKPKAGCNAIAEDTIKQLWLVCGDSLKVIDSQKRQLLASFGQADKVDMSSFLTGAQSLIIDSNGTILLGQRNGISQFKPLDQTKPNPPSQIALSHINYQYQSNDHTSIEQQINQNPFNLVGGVAQTISHSQYLHHGLKKIEFQFSSLDLARPKGSQYRYQLSGYDDHWTNTKADNRRANYTNLPAGEYVFKLQVKATGKAPSELLYPFTIEQKPWLSWWAFVIYTLMGFTMLYGLILLRTRTLRKQQSLLEQRIGQRTAQLQQSKQEVEHLMLERQKLIENIYHQTRTPLQIMLGNINALVNERLTIDAYANKQTDKVNALVHLTDQILDVSRVSSLTHDELQVIDFSSLIKPLILGFAEITQTKGIQFSWHIDEGMNIKGSVNSVENVIDNLLSNALKYTEQGAIRFSAKVQNNQVIVKCSDTGIGIAKSQQAQIFKRYQRADNSHDQAGAGIGLAMVKDVLDAIEGKIEVDSELGKGSTFTIVLPMLENDNNDAVPEYQLLKQQLQSTKANSSNSQTNDSASILIVEDNLELVNYMVSLLNDDYQVHTALNGQEGLKQAKDLVPDIIISDVMMAPMDGYEMTKQIRQDEITSHIPMLLVTAKSDEQSREKGFALGANDFINKPFKAPDLLNRIANQLIQIQAIQRRFKRQNEPHEISASDIEEDRLITRYLSFIAENYHDNNLKIKDACQALHISIRQLERKVRHFLDMTPNELLNDYRLSRAKELLQQGNIVSNVFDQCGFSSHAYFSKRFKEKYGHLPSQYKTDTTKAT